MCIEKKEDEKKMKQEGKSNRPKTRPKCPTQTRNHLAKRPSNRCRLSVGHSKSETCTLVQEVWVPQDKGKRLEERERVKHGRVKRKKEHDLHIQAREYSCKHNRRM